MKGRISTLIAACGMLIHCSPAAPAASAREASEPPISAAPRAARWQDEDALQEATLDELVTAGLARAHSTTSTLADRSPVVRELRRRGQPGLDALLLRVERDGSRSDAVDALIDAVAAQRYARHAGLYWHKDLDRALSQAKETGRPVLSLRMLGRLTQELSCANSRFFRVVLYPDPAVGKLLREHFVLHWSKERPAPKITVDYGDGRRLVRTITGNSAHYVLSADGRVLHVLPGLYHPDAFEQRLRRALTAPEQVEATGQKLSQWHQRQAEELALKETGSPSVASPIAEDDSIPEENGGIVSAAAAIPIAATKSAVEAPLAMPTFVEPVPEAEQATAEWESLAQRELERVRLSESTLELMRQLSSRRVDDRGRVAPLDDAQFGAMVARFRRTLALDTVRNRHELELQVHRYLAQEPQADFESVNRWVYETLFLTPASDPWLGLVPDGVFTALPGRGHQEPE